MEESNKTAYKCREEIVEDADTHCGSRQRNKNPLRFFYPEVDIVEEETDSLDEGAVEGYERGFEMGHGELRLVVERLPHRQRDAYLGAVEGPWVCRPWRRRKRY